MTEAIIDSQNNKNQRIGARVLGFLRGTKSGRDLESVRETTIVDAELIDYINKNPDLSAAYDEGKEAGNDHKAKKLRDSS